MTGTGFRKLLGLYVVSMLVGTWVVNMGSVGGLSTAEAALGVGLAVWHVAFLVLFYRHVRERGESMVWVVATALFTWIPAVIYYFASGKQRKQELVEAVDPDTG